MIRKCSFFTLIATYLSLAGYCQSPTETLFTLLKPEYSGIRFSNEISETEELNVLSYEYFYNGGGVAAGDVNNDGLIDLYFTANMDADKLYLNTGDLRFKDISKQAGIKSKEGWKTGVTMADVNADGFLDVYVSYSGGGETETRRNKLYINNGDLTFTEKAKDYGLDDASYSTQATFFDYDHDGDLDMYLLNHSIKDYKEVELKYLKTTYDSLAGDKLFRNDDNFFTDVSKQSGITGNPISFGLGVSVSDVNSDGWLDIYVSNDYQENDYLYINNGNGTFSERSHEMLNHMSNFSMGNDIADVNNDGLTDIFTLDMLPEDNKRQKLLKDPENYELYNASVANGFHHQFMRNMLHVNNGDNTFSEIGQFAGVSNTDWSWASLFADFDSDGHKDLLVTNGYLRDYTNKDFLKYWGNYLVQKATKMEKTYLMDIVKAMPSTKNQNYIFKNNADLTFTKMNVAWGLDQLVLSNGAAFADLDADGDLEIIINNVNEPAFIYRNNAVENGLKNSFIRVKLQGKDLNNRSAIGASMKVVADNHYLYYENVPSRGFQSAVPAEIHVGLGNLKVDSILVGWPDGMKEYFETPELNKTITLTQGNGILIDRSIKQVSPLLEKDTTLLSYVHKDYNYNDFKRQPFMPFMYSYTSPILVAGDMNKDGLEDLFIGSSKGQAGKVYFQNSAGMFDEQIINPRMHDDRYHSTTDAILLDADNDGDMDIYATSGMYHDYEPGNALLNDRLYLNDGSGFYQQRMLIETAQSGKSCARACDYDNDGDTDVFVGGRIVPGSFPVTPKSYLLENDGKGNFKDVCSRIASGLEYAGMITDATWVDMNADGRKDLVVVGEWMAVSVFLNTPEGFLNKTLSFFDEPVKGFWNTIKVEDLNGDGKPEILAGNLGTNTQVKASSEKPAELIYRDFDNNGSIDPFFCYYIGDKSYPDASRDMLLDQIYPMRKKFTSYESYSEATITDLFTEADLKTAARLSINELRTTLFVLENGKYKTRALPSEIQFSTIRSLAFCDLNQDGNKDILAFGNNSHSRLKYARMDANFGVVMLNKGNLQFEYIPQKQSGLSVKGDVMDVAVAEVKGQPTFLIGVNQGKLIVYRQSHNGRLYEN